MLCQECGEKVEEGAIFCPSCGNWLRAEGHQTSASSPSLSSSNNHGQEAERNLWLWTVGILAMALFLFGGIAGIGVLAAREGLRERERLIRERLNPHPRPTIDLRATLYDEAQALHRDGDWEGMFSILTELHGLDPEFRAPEVRELLFVTHSETGKELVAEDRLEEAIGHFAEALALKQDEAIMRKKSMASLYVAGTKFWEEAVWVKAIESFTTLYQLEGDYKDVRQRLYMAHMNQGDIYFSEDAWCLAERHYAEAHRILPHEMAAAKRDEAIQRCLATIKGLTPKAEE